MERTKGILGLVDGKRIYRIEEGEVSREEFAYSKILWEMVFGDRGIADTLGPTWAMVHDPRFAAVESCFVVERRPVFGGDAREGVQRQAPDGSFYSGIADLEQYSEVLGEGRHFLKAVKDRGYAPELFAGAGDDHIWAVILQECPNYFSRSGEPNQAARTLYKLFRADLLGLVADYAEVANVQEWVLLEDTETLVEPEHEAAGEPSVWAEVDLLEKALSYRASLRSTAAKILYSIGVEGLIETLGVRLTDLESDQLLHMVYSSDWPDRKPELVSKVFGFLVYVRDSGGYEERLAKQLAAASSAAREHVAGLKSGALAPITRRTDAAGEGELTDDGRLYEAVLSNPWKRDLLGLLTEIEVRLHAKAKAAPSGLRGAPPPPPPPPDGEERRLLAAAELISPVFSSFDYPMGEDEHRALLEEVARVCPEAALISGRADLLASPVAV